ncbi:MAG: GNAT family N-acetyltransferase [Planctomycetota bacterium]
MASTSKPVVVRWVPGAVSPDALDDVRAMRARGFAGMGPTPDEQTLANRRERAHRRWVRGEAAEEGGLMHVAEVDGAFVAVANTLRRTIHTPTGPVAVLGLAGVASDPTVRGGGFGKAVVRDAFARLDEEAVPHCLFQTGAARGFYEKLGATLVTNRFVNRAIADPEADPEASPWFDDCVMRYPAEAPWPDGVIDLNGPSY